MADLLPLVLVNDLIVDVKLQATDEHQDMIMQEAVCQLDDFLDDFKAEYNGSQKSSIDFVEYVKRRIKENQKEQIYGLSELALFQTNNLVEGVLKNVVSEARVILERKIKISEQISDLQSYLTLDINENELEDIQNKIRTMENQIIDDKIKIADLEQRYSEAVSKMNSATSELNKQVETYLSIAELKDKADRTKRYSIAIIDIELRDDIITTLFELSEEEKDSTSGIYYVARLIEIAIIPGVNFDENERKQLIELLIQDENKWRLFSSKEKDLCELLNLNDQHGNEAFIKVAIRRTEELSGEREKEFKDKIATLAFYCIWHCKVGEPYIKEALPVFFDDFINVSMIRMILDSKKLTEQQIYVKKTVCTISQDAIETSGSVDCSMLAAAILGYQDAPYSCADKMISRKKSGSDIIAICILEIGSWLLRYKIASDLRYDIEEAKWAKYQKFILNGILDNISYEARIKYLDVFGNLSALGVIKKHEVSWFRKDVFETVLRTALAEYGRTGEILEPSNGEINSCFRHLALYPGCFSKYCKNIIEEMNLDPTGLIEKIKAVQDHPVKLINKKVAAQLLFIMSDLK